jgi:hypothetical protein
MRKRYIFLIFAGLFAGIAGAYALRNWDPYWNIPQVTLASLNASETDWYAEGILDYDALVSVSFAAERRRYEVVVREGVLSAAHSSSLDEATGVWGPFTETSTEEAEFFTMPGLFSTMRAALLNEEVSREVLRLEVDGALFYPKRLVWGRIYEDGFPVDGTEVLIEVLEFEIR